MPKRPWTKEEDAILIKWYSKVGVEVVKQLQGRTVNAVKNRAQYLGLLNRQEMFGWSEEEIEILKNEYPLIGKKVLEKLPGRTLKTVQVTAHRLGIKRQFKKEK